MAMPNYKVTRSDLRHMHHGLGKVEMRMQSISELLSMT
jgi:hypothetical protein